MSGVPMNRMRISCFLSLHGRLFALFGVLVEILAGLHDGDAVQMVVLVLDAAGQQVLGFQFKPVAVAVLCTHLDGGGTGHRTVVPGKDRQPS